MRRELLGFAALIMLSATATAQNGDTIRSKLIDTQGKDVGSVTMRATPDNGVLLDVTISGLPPGPRAIHIHETGECEGDFKSAGGHFNPDDHQHGVLVEGGAHAGDLPNIHIAEDGRLQVEIFAKNVTLAKGEKNSLFDADGSSIIIHEGVDDYRSQPTGDAGGRIACAVLAEKTE